MAKLTLQDFEERFKELTLAREKLRSTLPDDGSVNAETVDELSRILCETANFDAELRAFTGRDPDSARTMMGERLFGPELWEKIGLSVGEDLPDLPESATELLESDCRLTEGKVKDTNRLIYVPGGTSILELVEKANSWCNANSDGPVFRHKQMDWLRGRDFAAEVKEHGEWVLMPLTLLPGSKDKTDAEQAALMHAEYPDYETPDAHAAFFALIGEFIQTGTRTWTNECGRCQSSVLLGFFDARGLYACQDAFTCCYVGRAACRKFKI